VYGSRFLGYKDCLYSGLNMAYFESWMKKQTFIELQEKQMKGIAESAELSLIRNALKSCIPNFETIYYDLRIEKVVYKEKEKGQMPLTFLSAGQKGILLMVVDMALKCIRLNPELREKANETPGTVLIDEIELHLHPSWQRIVLPGLSKAFPNIQFIVTTHSPQVISSVSKECVFILQDFQVKPAPAFTEGRDTNALLEEIFGVEERPKAFKEKLGRFYALLDEEKPKEAKMLLDELTEKWGSLDAEIVRASLYHQDLLDEQP
jgi:predicted ATP-binding protein involved in virulence